MIISAKVIRRNRKQRPCGHCSRIIIPGDPALRLYGAAETGDKPWAMYLHPNCCTDKLDAKIKAALLEEGEWVGEDWRLKERAR